MWYGDPRQSRRAAKEARHAAKYAYKANRRAARYAYKDARRAYRYRRPGGGIISLVFLVFLILFFITHIWVWLIAAFFAVAITVFILRMLGLGSSNRWFANQQQPQTPPIYQSPQQPYQSYDQGYQPDQRTYQEGGQQHQFPQQLPSSYQQPQAQYPQQIPPMEQ